MKTNKSTFTELIRFSAVCELVMSDNENPDLTDFTKEELLHFGRVATMSARINLNQYIFWRRAAIVSSVSIILSIIIDLLKMAEVI